MKVLEEKMMDLLFLNSGKIPREYTLASLDDFLSQKEILDEFNLLDGRVSDFLISDGKDNFKIVKGLFNKDIEVLSYSYGIVTFNQDFYQAIEGLEVDIDKIYQISNSEEIMRNPILRYLLGEQSLANLSLIAQNANDGDNLFDDFKFKIWFNKDELKGDNKKCFGTPLTLDISLNPIDKSLYIGNSDYALRYGVWYLLE